MKSAAAQPAASAVAAAASGGDAATLDSKIAEAGNTVRQLKTDKAAKVRDC